MSLVNHFIKNELGSAYKLSSNYEFANDSIVFVMSKDGIDIKRTFSRTFYPFGDDISMTQTLRNMKNQLDKIIRDIEREKEKENDA